MGGGDGSRILVVIIINIYKDVMVKGIKGKEYKFKGIMKRNE